MEMSGDLHTLTALVLMKNPVPTEQEAGWASVPVQMFWSREKSLAPARMTTFGKKMKT
jgi:hypothetical protein